MRRDTPRRRSNSPRPWKRLGTFLITYAVMLVGLAVWTASTFPISVVAALQFYVVLAVLVTAYYLVSPVEDY